ncbi:MAG TPA: SPOR domain-containing protein [Rhizobiaceae bacterium]|nr:SPOR domain-containing protein [Rhizobiaceae bacterium]
MAESNNLKRVVHDSDPFAELERIMGTGARAPAQDEAEQDPFQLDLERELLGEFTQDHVEPAAPQSGLRFRQPDDEAQVSDHRYSGQAQAPEWQREDAAESEPEYEAAATHAAPVEGEIDLAAEMDAIFAEEFDDQPLSDNVEAAGRFAPAGDAVHAQWQDDAAAFDELPPEVDDAAVEEFHPQDEAPYAAAEPAEAPVTALESVNDGLADVDMDFGDLSAELETAAQDWYQEQQAEVTFESAPADEPAQVAEEDVQAAQVHDEPTLSLEDELVMLLGDNNAAAPSHAYGRANYAPVSVNQWSAPAAAAEVAPEPAPEGDNLELDDWQPDLAVAEETIDSGLEDELALDHEQFEPAHAEYRGSATAEVATDAVDVFAAPDAGSAPVETAPADFDLDIVAVPEGHVAVADDLDLPQLPVEEERSSSEPFDELEAEFAEMFRVRKPEQSDVAETAATDEGLDDYYFNEALGVGAAGLTYGRATPTAAQPSYAGAAGADAYDDDDGMAEAAEMPAAAAASRGMPRRNLVIAGAVGALALLGVVGVFAFTGGDSNDAPALVRADEQPMKVRPENPGGTTVPNQDSQAYQRAAGGAGDTVPAQRELVTTAEEPVNVAAKAEDEAPLLQPEAEATDTPAPSLDALPGVNLGEKIEDRVPVQQDIAGTGLNEDLVAVTPRRVRTMVVRPDGTLVPREEVAAAPAEAAPQPAPASQAPRAVVPAAQPETPTVQQAAPLPTPAPQQQAAAPQPAPQPAAPAPALQPQQVAAAPQAPRTQPEAPAAPAAASGEWSMQIASQPTAEGAQATYQDLARRYGEVLSGRGVNIVRAEIQGKGTYYRVRIPSATRNDAISLCERYKAAGGSCFVSK